MTTEATAPVSVSAATVAAEPAPVTPTTTPVSASPGDAKAAAKESAYAAFQARTVPASPPAEPVAAEPVVQVVDANGREHAADGKYLPAEAGSVTAKPEPVSTQIRVEVPEGHWLRDQGVTEQFAPNEAEARRLRGLLKDASRRSEVATLREQLIAAQAQLRATQESRESIVTDPDTLARVRELRELGHTDLADLILAGLDKKQSDKVSEYTAAERAKFAEQDTIEVVQTFRDETIQAARSRYPDFWVNSPSFAQAAKQALFQYANDVSFREQSGESVALKADGVWDYLDRIYLRDPEAQRHAKQRIAQRIQAAPPPPSDAALRHATNTPLAVVPSATRNDRLSTVPAGIDRTKMSPDQLKRFLKGELIHNQPA